MKDEPVTPPKPDAGTVDEATIAALVTRFYDRAHEDPLLEPVLVAAIQNWDDHIARFRDFWCHHLLGTPRAYSANMFMAHAVLPLQPAHFDRWLALFDETAAELLPADLHQRAMARANHVAASVKAGMFTVPGHRFGAT